MNVLDNIFFEVIERYSSIRKTEEEKKEIADIFNQLKNKIIPEKYPSHLTKGVDSFAYRREIIELVGFPLISYQWIKPLAKWIGNKKCLEVMSGCGSLSYALKREGVDIISTDDFSWEGQGEWNKTKKYWTEIENIDAVESVKKYGKDIDIIIMSWAFMDNIAYQVLQTMREINPECVIIYIGEGHGGCTADNDFYKSIIEVEDKEFYEINGLYQQWMGIHDCLWLVK